MNTGNAYLPSNESPSITKNSSHTEQKHFSNVKLLRVNTSTAELQESLWKTKNSNCLRNISKFHRIQNQMWHDLRLTSHGRKVKPTQQIINIHHIFYKNIKQYTAVQTPRSITWTRIQSTIITTLNHLPSWPFLVQMTTGNAASTTDKAPQELVRQWVKPDWIRQSRR